MPKFSFTVYLETDTEEEAFQVYNAITDDLDDLDNNDFHGIALIYYDDLEEVEEI